MKMIKTLLLLLMSMLILLFFTYGNTNTNYCEGKHIDINNNFFKFIDKHSEEKRKHFYQSRGLIGGVTWNEPNRDVSKYTVMETTGAEEIYKNPDEYICEAIHVIQSPQYDQSQKAYSIMLMHLSSVQNQIRLLKAANEAYEKQIITDKEVLAELLYSPELGGYSTNAQYTWLPAWRREFNKHAHEVLDQKAIDDVLFGKTLLWKF